MIHSPELRKAKKEIAIILRKYNIAGAVLLADGKGMGEYGNYIDLPNWSAVSFENTFLRIKTTGKDIASREVAEKTVNALVIIRDMAIQQATLNQQILDKLGEHFKIIEDKNPKNNPEENILQ